MSDIVERLRHHEREYPSLIHGPLCGEAADEIDRLLAISIITDEQLRVNDAEIERLQKRYDRLLKAFGELQVAAQNVCDETDRIHDKSPWPQKYRAPYGAIVGLRQLIARQYGLRGQSVMQRARIG